MKEVNRKLFGDEIVDRTADIYGLDAEGELRGSYRPSGHPGVSRAVIVREKRSWFANSCDSFGMQLETSSFHDSTRNHWYDH